MKQDRINRSEKAALGLNRIEQDWTGQNRTEQVWTGLNRTDQDWKAYNTNDFVETGNKTIQQNKTKKRYLEGCACAGAALKTIIRNDFAN